MIFFRSEINDPPSFNKKESRFEREQRIRVGNVQTYVPGAPSGVRENFSPPPGNSDKERFRVQPGRIEDYSLGRGTIAQKEAQQVTEKLIFPITKPFFLKSYLYLVILYFQLHNSLYIFLSVI